MVSTAVFALLAFSVFIGLVRSAEKQRLGEANGNPVAPIKPAYAWILCVLATVFALISAVVVAFDQDSAPARAPVKPQLTEQLLSK